jgi:gluconolactonase
MDANAEIPSQKLEGERVMIMMGGSVEHTVNGEVKKMVFEEPAYQFFYSNGYVGYRHCLYLEAGSEYSVKAGEKGATFVELYAPVRADYVKLAGGTLPATVKPAAAIGTPNFPSGQVFNYYEIQYTQLVDGAWSRIINGKSIQVSNLFMWPGIEFAFHNHPEEQLMAVLNGSIDEWIMNSVQTMNAGNVLFLPAQMVHGAKLSDTGCEAIDVFYPPRADYTQKMNDRYAAYHAIIPEGTEPTLLQEGFKFTEGPTWMDGEYYFSSMFFDIPAGTWALDPSKSDLIAMKPDGSWRYVLKGKLQTNGLMLKGNGNLVACDMQGHRIVEISPKGREVKVLATKITAGDIQKGLRLDGPNDLIIDAKGGIYFTDPKFINGTAERPSKTLNYIRPDGEVVCVIENADLKEFNMINGVELSPDGKTLYINNTYHHEGKISEAANFIWAYDVNEDGTLANKRKFCEQFLPVAEWINHGRSSCSDGMVVDAQGNLYTATTMGLQIFNPKGEFIGIVYTPTFPVSVCFGGPDFDTLFMTCWDKIYTIKTNVKGLVYPLQAK